MNAETKPHKTDTYAETANICIYKYIYPIYQSINIYTNRRYKHNSFTSRNES